MDIRAAREGLADLLRAALPDWRVEDYVPDSPNPPALIIGSPQTVTYNLTLSSRGTIELPVTVVVSASDTRSAQIVMDGALGAGVEGSVYDALHGVSGDGFFGPVVVLRAENIGRAQTVGGAQLFAADIVVQIVA